MTPEHKPQVLFLVKVIGILLLTIGILLFTSGAIFHFAGDQAKIRYQSSAGELLRAFSSEDQTYYNSLRALMYVGHAAKILSVFVFVAGAFVFWAPHLLYYSAMRVRRGDGICAQQESNLQPTD